MRTAIPRGKAARSRPPRVALIGAPCDAGGRVPGTDQGPQAMRCAGLAGALGRSGFAVDDRGDVTGPAPSGRPPVDGYRHLDEVAAWSGGVRAAVGDALADGDVPLVMGGDHSVAIGSVAAVAAHCAGQRQPVCVVWLDAHADMNTGATSPSSNVHGMPMAVACGHGAAPLLDLGHARPMVPPEHVFQVGIRSVDAAEQRLIDASGITVYSMEDIRQRGMDAVIAEILAAVERLDAHLHVSLDLDFVDPADAPGIGTPEPDGPHVADARAVMDRIHASGRLGSLDVVELNPVLDESGRTARMGVELVGHLFGEDVLAKVV